MGDTVATNAECVAVTRLDGTGNRYLADLVHIGTGVTDRRHRRAICGHNRCLQGCPRINGAENDRRSTLAFGPDHGTHIRIGANGTHQAGADGCRRITRLSRVTHCMCIDAIRDAEAVLLALRNAGQVNPVNLVQAGHRIVQDINRHRRIIKTARVVKRFSRSEEGVGRTIDAKALTINTITRAILAVGFPSDHEAAVFERRHRRIILMARSVGVDLELIAEAIALRVITLTKDTVVRTILTAGLPGDDKAAVQQGRNIRLCLLTRGVAVGLELITVRAAIGVEALAIDAVARAILTAGFPGNDEAAVGEVGNRRVVLVVARIGVDLELGAIRIAVGIEALAVNTVVAVAVTIGVEVILVTALPCNHEAAILERGNRWILLIIIRLRINLEGITRLFAIHIKALAVDTVTFTIPV